MGWRQASTLKTHNRRLAKSSGPEPTSSRWDAYPTRDGKIVDNLTRDDFEVFEDGKRQSIEQFEFVRGVPDGPDAEPRPTRLEAAERLAGDARRRVFVVYLTGYHASIEGAANTQKATTAFFNQSVSTSDLFGVLRLYDDVRDLVLGDRPDALVDEANSYWDWASLPHPKGWPRLPKSRPSTAFWRRRLLRSNESRTSGERSASSRRSKSWSCAWRRCARRDRTSSCSPERFRCR